MFSSATRRLAMGRVGRVSWVHLGLTSCKWHMRLHRGHNYSTDETKTEAGKTSDTTKAEAGLRTLILNNAMCKRALASLFPILACEAGIFFVLYHHSVGSQKRFRKHTCIRRRDSCFVYNFFYVWSQQCAKRPS